MKLTNSVIKGMAYEKTGNKADLRFDDELKGFGIRVYPSGRKAFFISYTNSSGTKKRHNFATFGEMTATQARNHARDLLADVRKGQDPQAERQEKRSESTFEELAQRYIDDYAKHHKRSWHDDRQRFRDHILPSIGKKKLSEISLSRLQKLHTKVRERTSAATANRVAALVKHTFAKAGEWQLIQHNPAQHLKLFREPPPRDIFLSPEECGRIIEACDSDENVFASGLFKLAMFTGRRVGEILNMKWSDVDLDGGIITLAETKAGERQFIYLNELAEATLHSIPRIEGNPYVIVGLVPGKPLNFYRRAWNRILKRADLPSFPPHGLRHNYASTLVAAGIPIETVGHLLGHKNLVTTRKYAHHRPDHLRRAAETFGDVIKLDPIETKSVK